MDFHSKNQVSLRGASKKEISRDGLLTKASEDRLKRLVAKRESTAALTIQKQWRSFQNVSMLKKRLRVEWDQEVVILRRNAAYSADNIAANVLSPLLFILHRRNGNSWLVEINLKDDSRVRALFRLLFECFDKTDPKENLFSLAQTQPAKWRFLIHRLLSLCCHLLHLDSSSYKSESAPSANEAKLANLAMQSALLLSILSNPENWKCYNSQKPAENGNATFQENAQSLTPEFAVGSAKEILEWLGRNRFFATVRSFLLRTRPYSAGKLSLTKSEGSDLIFAGKLLLLAAKVAKMSGVSSSLAEFCACILTIPMLSQRLPGKHLQAISQILPQIVHFLSMEYSQFESAVSSSGQELSSGGSGIAMAAPFWVLCNLSCMLPSLEASQKAAGQEEWLSAVTFLSKDLEPWLKAHELESFSVESERSFCKEFNQWEGSSDCLESIQTLFAADRVLRQLRLPIKKVGSYFRALISVYGCLAPEGGPIRALSRLALNPRVILRLRDAVGGGETDWTPEMFGAREMAEKRDLFWVFCRSYAVLLSVTDDEEFYVKQAPFSTEFNRSLALCLNCAAHRAITAKQNKEELSAILACLLQLYSRDCRRGFCGEGFWVIDEVRADMVQEGISLVDPTEGETVPAAGREPWIDRIRSLFFSADEVGMERETYRRLRWTEEGTNITGGGGSERGFGHRQKLGDLLKTVPHVVDFDERVYIFRKLVENERAKYGYGSDQSMPLSKISVRRNYIVEDGVHGIMRLEQYQLKGMIKLTFVNEHGLEEAGIDQGGLSKEFLTEFTKALTDPRLGLFKESEGTSVPLLYPHPGLERLGNSLRTLEAVGRIVGRALLVGNLLEVSFAPFFVSKLLGNSNNFGGFDEVASLDTALHKGLLQIKHYSGDVRDFSLDFTVEEEVLGRKRVVELCSGGSHIAVTNENKMLYVLSMADYKLNRQMQRVSSVFAQGLFHIIPQEWLQMFNPTEFNQLLSGGSLAINVNDWKENSVYGGGYTKSSRQIVWFWDAVSSMKVEEKSLLLKFVTSCPRPPLQGFKYLNPPFTIHKVSCEASVWAAMGGQDVDRLPSASTCYNTLKLPNYQRASTMKKKIILAINANAGFELS